jgi:hypothetical protein
MPECFFAHRVGRCPDCGRRSLAEEGATCSNCGELLAWDRCEGRLVKAHLVPKQTLKRELHLDKTFPNPLTPIWDSRCWRWMCGGWGYGSSGHHGAYDAYQIRLHAWPEDFLEFLREYDIEWMADRYATESTRRA